MTTILVIEDDAISRSYVRDAAPADATVLEAGDGLDGLDAFRQHAAVLDLVVLDLDMPRLHGRNVLPQIRERRPDLPVLLLTAMVKEAELLAHLPGVHVVRKPVRPHVLAGEIASALRLPLSELPNPLVTVLSTQSAEVEALRRLPSPGVRVAVYATSAVKRAGIAAILRVGAQVFEATTPAALDALLGTMTWTAVIADGHDRVTATAAAQTHALPLILVVDTPAQAAQARAYGAAMVIIAMERTVELQLQAALDALATGTPYNADALRLEQVRLGSGLVPPAVARQFSDTALTERELEVLWLTLQGDKRSDIAAQLDISGDTVKSHWQNIQHKLGRSRDAVLEWAGTRLGVVPDELDERAFGA